MPASNKKSSMVQKVQYDAKLGQLYKIWLLNLIYSIFTLGIYSFWGRTRLRKYLARCLTLQNDRFEYTGKGKELFLAFLKVMGVFVILTVLYISIEYVVHNILEKPFLMDILDTTLAVVYLPVLFFLVYAGIYSAVRYRRVMTESCVWRR